MHPGATRNQLRLPRLIAVSIIFLFNNFISSSQTHLDSLPGNIDPQKWSAVVEKKITNLESKIIAKSEETLPCLQNNVTTKFEVKYSQNLLI